ncbi:MAG TPA: serine hydrolase [Actinomycetota bacterium]|nr:serine hydrolase [Actinomycetota bacterium]
MAQEIPDTPVGRQISWALDILDGKTKPDRDDLLERFAPEMLRQVPVDQLLAVLEQVGPMVRPFSLERFDNPPTEAQAVAVLARGDGDYFRLMAQVDPKPPHRIQGMLIQPAPDLRKEPVAKNWGEVESKVRELAKQVSFLAAEVVSGELVPIHEVEPDTHLALGSTFKLYVLGELARRVEAGEAAWDDELPIQAKLKSIPSGTMQDAKAGTKFPLREYAEKMISISDNTATDHLLHHLGRERVEDVQAAMGHSDPSLNVPFLTTREMTVLKAGADPRIDSFIAAEPEARRKMLAGPLAKAKLPKIPDEMWTSPRHNDTVEWFASASDLGRAMAWLRDCMSRPATKPVEKVLSLNPGLPLDRYAWTYIGFKGGSEPGVLNMTWLLRRLDDRWFVLTATLNDDGTSAATFELGALMLASSALLVMHRKAPGKRKLLGRRR